MSLANQYAFRKKKLIAGKQRKALLIINCVASASTITVLKDLDNHILLKKSN